MPPCTPSARASFARHLAALCATLALLSAAACTDEEGATRGSDSLSFSIQGDEVIVDGIIDHDTPEALAELLERNPTMDVFVLREIEGSEDDDANLEAARMIREAGITTVVESDGMVASGGTDFFLAGAQRIVESGACIGVHTWSDASGLEGAELPEDDPAHEPYLDFYLDMGVDEDFYWFTLDAAPAEGMHWLTWSEMADHGVGTEYVVVDGVDGECEEADADGG